MMMVRRKLFSSPTPPRRRLFSEPESDKVCIDCGYRVTDSTVFVCPCCGGKRFRYVEPLEETPDTEAEAKLKTYSGRAISQEEFDRIFSGDDMIPETMFSDSADGKVCISKDAYWNEKLFSKLVVSVTKILDLPPVPKDTSEAIHGLNLPPKGILLLKKAHCVEEPCCGEWAKDSGILGDLRLEFGGHHKPISEFVETIKKRYPDAPDGLMDFLKEKGIINVSGEDVEILK